MGQVGASRALEIAERSGIEAGVLREARAFLPEGERHLREILGALDEEIAAHEREIGRLRDKEKELDGARAQVRKARAALEDEKRRFLEGLPEHLEAWREAFLSDLKAEVNRQTVKRVAARALPKVAEKAASDLGLQKPAELPRPLPEPGDRVRMKVYGLEGDVVETDAGTGRLTVDCRGKTLVVGHGDVEILARSQKRELPRGGGVEGPGKDAAWEINLIGQTVAEAETALEPFMDRAALAGLGQVRIIHGIGTGRLRAAVRQWLKRCPHVAGWEEAPPSGGGAGATLVALKA